MSDYSYITVKDRRRVVAHLFVAPQEHAGLDIGYVELDEDEGGIETPIVAGDIYIGNPEAGYYTIDFELGRPDRGGLFSFGEEEYDLNRGRCFLVKEGYEIVQLPYQSKDEAARYLAKQRQKP